MLSNNRVQYL